MPSDDGVPTPTSGNHRPSRSLSTSARVLEQRQARPGLAVRGHDAGQRGDAVQALALHVGLRLRPPALAADLDQGGCDPG